MGHETYNALRHFADSWGLLAMFVFFVGGLSSLHIFLVSTNQTTYENFRYSYDQDNRNPYNKGCLGNWYEVFCLPIPPSKCDFRAVVEEVAVG